MDSFQLFEDRMMEGEADTSGMKLDPSIFIAILSALIPLLQGCFKPTPASARRPIHHPRIAVAIKRERPDLSYADCRAYATKVIQVATRSTDEEVAAFITEATS